jgi:hypothetical protein
LYRGVDKGEEHAEGEGSQDRPAHDTEYTEGRLKIIYRRFRDVVFSYVVITKTD